MSEENLELVQRAVAAINRHDLPALLELMDQEVQVFSRIVAVEGGLHGHEGFREWWASWLEAFPDWQVEVVAIRRHGDVVIAKFRGVGHGASSRVPFVDDAWLTSQWREGRCLWWQVCRTEDEACKAAGLSE
jgi:hypothetical protein